MTAYETWKAQYPLHALAQLGDVNTVQQDLQLFLPLFNTADNEKWLPIHYACFEGHAEFVALLLEHGDAATLVSAPNHFGSTPLHLAVGTSNVPCLKVLLQHITTLEQLNAANEDKEIPLKMVRIAEHSQKELSLLLEEKAAEIIARR